jgi:hypothetical protein
MLIFHFEYSVNQLSYRDMHGKMSMWAEQLNINIDVMIWLLPKTDHD